MSKKFLNVTKKRWGFDFESGMWLFENSISIQGEKLRSKEDPTFETQPFLHRCRFASHITQRRICGSYSSTGLQGNSPCPPDCGFTKTAADN